MDPIDVVLSFAEEMNDWEYKMYLLSRIQNGQTLNHAADQAAVPDLSYDDFKNTYYEIFDRYCTKRDRSYGGQPNSWSKKGQYEGVSKDSVISESYVQKNKVEVIIEGGQFPDNKFLFVLVKRADQWRIDSAKWGDVGDWSTHYL